MSEPPNPTARASRGAHGRPADQDRGVFVMSRNQHVVPHGEGWAVKGAGSERATSLHRTQGEAIERAREIARNQESELVIHRPNGQIRDKDSYGNDPFPPKG